MRKSSHITITERAGLPRTRDKGVSNGDTNHATAVRDVGHFGQARAAHAASAADDEDDWARRDDDNGDEGQVRLPF